MNDNNLLGAYGEVFAECGLKNHRQIKTEVIPYKIKVLVIWFHLFVFDH